MSSLPAVGSGGAQAEEKWSLEMALTRPTKLAGTCIHRDREVAFLTEGETLAEDVSVLVIAVTFPGQVAPPPTGRCLFPLKHIHTELLKPRPFFLP